MKTGRLEFKLKKIHGLLFVLCFLGTHISFSQEWKSLKAYTNSTGEINLQEGCWLKKDRTRNTAIWQQANRYNLSQVQGNIKYTTICQIRDFYFWFDQERKNRGHEIITAGVAAIVAGQLANFENRFISSCIVRSKELEWFASEGSQKVLAHVFPLFYKVYLSKQKLIGQEARNWDQKYITKEQCQIIEPLYEHLSPKAIKKLIRIAKGKGIYSFGVKKKLRFEGDIQDCTSRYAHAFHKLYPYYLKNQQAIDKENL